MRNIILLLSLVFSATSIHAQESYPDFGGFGGPYIQVGSIKGNSALIFGGGGGFIFKHSYFVGGYGEAIASGVKTDDPAFINHRFYLSHSGLWFGYIARLNQKNGLFFSAKMGWGGATLIEDAAISYANEYFVFNPSLEYERLFSSFVKIGIGIAWPFYNGINNPVYNDNDVSKPAAIITIRLGYF